jgi:hypothetical protein
MNVDRIMLSPEEVQGLLDCMDIIPSNHYMCISRNVDTDKKYVCDCGKDGWSYGQELEITEETKSL